MTEAPSLSVIIPCYRSGEPLKDQIVALVDQDSAPSREIILCDNGGNPWLREHVDRLTELPPDVEVRVIDAQEHPGAAYARNRGISEARAKRLAFCDDDDLVHPEWCRHAHALLETYPVVTGGVVTKQDSELRGLDARSRREMLVTETAPVPPQPAGRGSMGPALMGGNFAARREVLLKVGGFDASLARGGEDNDLAYRLDQAGVPITDCGAMSIIYARPSAVGDRVRARARAGRALVEAVAVRDAWEETPELSRPPAGELAKAVAAFTAMSMHMKKPDWTGATDRVATAWGLTQGWAAHRVRRQMPTSSVGAGLAVDAPSLHPGTTVLVVAYNHASYVVDTLESIRQQTVAPVRVLIADDASPSDDTRRVIQEWLTTAPSSFEFHPNERNIGLNATLNSLLRMVDTEFVTYIAGDDTMRADRIAVHEDLLRRAGKDTVLAYSDARVIDEHSTEIHPSSRVEFPWPAEPARSENTSMELLRSNWIPAASIFLRTSTLHQEGGYREDLFFEDFELLMRLSLRHRFAYSEDPLVEVRRLSTSLGAVGFAHDSPRFIHATFTALGHASGAKDCSLRDVAAGKQWELAKRARRVGMPRHEVIRMMWQSRRGSRSPLVAASHMARTLFKTG